MIFIDATFIFHPSLPVPSRDEIMASPRDDVHDEQKMKVMASPVDEDPAAGFERELHERQ